MTETEEKIAEMVRALLPIGAVVEPHTPLWHKDVAFLSGDASRITPDTDELDSLDRVDLAMTIEDTFSIEIPDDDTTDYQHFGTVAAIAAYVDERLAGKAA